MVMPRGADIAGNVYLSLGHAIGHTVGRVTVNGDRRTGVEPSHIVRRRSQHIDKGARISHRSQPLAGMAVDFDMHGLAIGPPKAATDTVLAIGMNGQLTMARVHGLLNLFFENPRGHTLAVMLSPIY